MENGGLVELEVHAIGQSRQRANSEPKDGDEERPYPRPKVGFEGSVDGGEHRQYDLPESAGDSRGCRTWFARLRSDDTVCGGASIQFERQTLNLEGEASSVPRRRPVIRDPYAVHPPCPVARLEVHTAY